MKSKNTINWQKNISNYSKFGNYVGNFHLYENNIIILYIKLVFQYFVKFKAAKASLNQTKSGIQFWLSFFLYIFWNYHKILENAYYEEIF